MQTIPNFRIRTIPVLGTMPAVFGIAAAAHVLCHLAGAPFFAEPPFHMRRPQYETILEALQEEEAAAHGTCDHVCVDLEEARPFLLSCGFSWLHISAGIKCMYTEALGAMKHSTYLKYRTTSSLRRTSPWCPEAAVLRRWPSSCAASGTPSQRCSAASATARTTRDSTGAPPACASRALTRRRCAHRATWCS